MQYIETDLDPCQTAAATVPMMRLGGGALGGQDVAVVITIDLGIDVKMNKPSSYCCQELVKKCIDVFN